MSRSVSALFDEEFLADIASSVPVEGAGFERDFRARIANAYFAEAGPEYQKMVKAGLPPALQMVWDIENPDWDKPRQEKYTIGTGWKLDGGDGKTAPRVVATGVDKDGKPYSQFSASSNYGRIYRNLTERWELNEDNAADCQYEMADGSEITISPAGLRFFKFLKKNGKRVNPKDASIWLDVELQWSKEEYQDKNGKTKDRAFPSALLHPGVGDDVEVAASTKKVEAKKDEPKKSKEPDKEKVKEEKTEEKEAVGAVGASAFEEGESAEDILGQLTSLALEHDPPDYNEWRKHAIKMKGVQGVKKWVNWCIIKKNFEDLVTGNAKPPA